MTVPSWTHTTTIAKDSSSVPRLHVGLLIITWNLAPTDAMLYSGHG